MVNYQKSKKSFHLKICSWHSRIYYQYLVITKNVCCLIMMNITGPLLPRNIPYINTNRSMLGDRHFSSYEEKDLLHLSMKCQGIKKFGEITDRVTVWHVLLNVLGDAACCLCILSYTCYVTVRPTSVI